MPSLTLLYATLYAVSGIAAANTPPSTPAIVVPSVAPQGAGEPWKDFVSFSIEASSFPEFAGNLSNPNKFSYNLLKNIKDFTGTYPVIRVGGSTQDQITFDPNAKFAMKGILNASISSDYPVDIITGPAYYESYQTWPGVRYVHGFNLGNKTSRDATLKSAPYVCKTLKDRLDSWELGNEPDLFWLPGQRPLTYTEAEYVNEWVNMSRQLKSAMSCTEGFMAPSFAGTAKTSFFRLDQLAAWQAGLNVDKDISHVSQHNYMEAATTPGVTLQHTLMNHSSIMQKVTELMNYSSSVKAYTKAPYILGEHNSLARQGKPGISNSFGAALWGVDFNLAIASQGIKRSHMHQGTNYRYQAWQPVETNTTKGTKAPYYGNIAVAKFLGGLKSIVNLPVSSELSAAYAGYNRGLKRVIAINMQQYNASVWNVGYLNDYPRPVETVTFDMSCGGTITRLMANGSDAITGITFDGFSYNWELDNGKPVLMKNTTRGETVRSRGGKVTIQLPYSSVAILDLKCD